MTTTKLKFITDGTTTFSAADVADTFASVLTGTIDLGSPAPVALSYEFIFLSEASANDFVHLRGFWSIDGTDFSDLNNPMDIRSVKSVASTTIKAVGSFPVEAQHIKFDFLNESGGVIDGVGTTPTLVLREIEYDQT